MSFISQYYYELVSVGLVITSIAIVYLLYFCIPAGQAYVRTGLGRPKVVFDGGMLVLPIVHKVTSVDLQSYTLNVTLVDKHSLMSQDFIRIDLTAAMTVRIAAHAEGVLVAMRALNGMSLQEGKLRVILEAESIAILRSVAASMSLETLHQRRYEFSDAVHKRLSLPLQQYGLELVAISLLELEQTAKAFYDTGHILDAKGLAVLERWQAAQPQACPTLTLVPELESATVRKIMPLQLAVC